jgi:hypothetical protein
MGGPGEGQGTGKAISFSIYPMLLLVAFFAGFIEPKLARKGRRNRGDPKCSSVMLM